MGWVAAAGGGSKHEGRPIRLLAAPAVPARQGRAVSVRAGQADGAEQANAVQAGDGGARAELGDGSTPGAGPGDRLPEPHRPRPDTAGSNPGGLAGAAPEA